MRSFEFSPEGKTLKDPAFNASVELSDALLSGTRLADMGMRMENIQRILRHANISTTAGFYVFPNDAKMKTGLKKLTETVRKKYGIKA